MNNAKFIEMRDVSVSSTSPCVALVLIEATIPIVKCVCMCVCVVWVSVAGFLSLLGWEMTRVTHLSSCHTVGVSPQRPRCHVSDLSFFWAS